MRALAPEALSHGLEATFFASQSKINILILRSGWRRKRRGLTRRKDRLPQRPSGTDPRDQSAQQVENPSSRDSGIADMTIICKLTTTSAEELVLKPELEQMLVAATGAGVPPQSWASNVRFQLAVPQRVLAIFCVLLPSPAPKGVKSRSFHIRDRKLSGSGKYERTANRFVGMFLARLRTLRKRTNLGTGLDVIQKPLVVVGLRRVVGVRNPLPIESSNPC